MGRKKALYGRVRQIKVRFTELEYAEIKRLQALFGFVTEVEVIRKAVKLLGAKNNS